MDDVIEAKLAAYQRAANAHDEAYRKVEVLGGLLRDAQEASSAAAIEYRRTESEFLRAAAKK